MSNPLKNPDTPYLHESQFRVGSVEIANKAQTLSTAPVLISIEMPQNQMQVSNKK